MAEEFREAIEAGTREGTRRRILLDRGYRVRWSFGTAVLVGNVIATPLTVLVLLVPTSLSAWWLVALLALMVCNLVARVIAPPFLAPPTESRLLAERVLTLSPRIEISP